MSDLSGRNPKPLVLVDAGFLIRTSPYLMELALTAGTPVAVQSLLDNFTTAYQDLHQPTLLVVNRQYAGFDPTGGEPYDPARPVTVDLLINDRNLSAEDFFREVIAGQVAAGRIIEVVTGDPALRRGLRLARVHTVQPADYMGRIARALARVTADRLRAEAELQDTDAIVASMIQASADAPPRPSGPAEASPDAEDKAA